MADEEKKEEVKNEIKELQKMIQTTEAEYGYLPEEEKEEKDILDNIMSYLKETMERKKKELMNVS